MAKEGPNRDPGVHCLRHGLQGIEWSDEDRPVEGPHGGEFRSDSATDAKTYSYRSLRLQPLDREIEQQRRVGDQRLRRWRTGRRFISAIVECDDGGFGKKPIEVFGNVLSVPGIASEPKD